MLSERAAAFTASRGSAERPGPTPRVLGVARTSERAGAWLARVLVRSLEPVANALGER